MKTVPGYEFYQSVIKGDNDPYLDRKVAATFSLAGELRAALAVRGISAAVTSTYTRGGHDPYAVSMCLDPSPKYAGWEPNDMPFRTAWAVHLDPIPDSMFRLSSLRWDLAFARDQVDAVAAVLALGGRPRGRGRHGHLPGRPAARAPGVVRRDRAGVTTASPA